jgi:hypothetical protein
LLNLLPEADQVLASFIMRIPDKIKAPAARRMGDAGSPRIAIPSNNEPTAPIPVQTV